jgi:AAA15 family ATPase/GTPase
MEGMKMLLEFSFENYGSFRENATLDMRATSYSEHDYFIMENGRYRGLPVAAIFGSNASGKSTVVNAFYCMRSYLLYSLVLSQNNTTNKNDSINDYYRPFLLSRELQNDLIKFSFSLLRNDCIYRFRFSYNRNGVYNEELTRRKNKPYAQESILYNILEGKFIKKHKEIESLSRIFEGIDKTSLFITFLNNKDQRDAVTILHWFGLCAPYHLGNTENMESTAQFVSSMYYKGSENQAFCKKIIQRIDPCIIGFDVIEQKKDESIKNETKYSILFHHKLIEGATIPFLYGMESDGTQKVYLLCIQLYGALKFGAICVLDELDSRLHPMVIEYIVSLFHDPEENTGHGQLVFTTHNPVMLNHRKMRRDEIWFTEKDINGQSSLYSLADIKGVRPDADYLDNYFYGNYGAVPFVNGCDNDAE